MVQENLKKKYGIFTAIAMVVGIVVGSGVFFKAEKILLATGGDMKLGILAWILGGLIMIFCAYTFAVMAAKYVYVNGIVDYADVTVGDKYGYAVGWFMAAIYYPTLASVLSWVSASYFCILMGWQIDGGEAMSIALFLMVGSFALNVLSPMLAGKFQVTTTVIKLIPLLLMGIGGTIVGLKNGMMIDNFTNIVSDVSDGNPLFIAVCATSFAYDGWIVATCINSEIKDAKKNLPRALVIGTALIMFIYIIYYIGLSGAVENSVLMSSGQEAVKIAFNNVFTDIGGILLMVFLVISCVGTLNGLMLGCCRGVYSLAARDRGPNPDCLKSVDAKTHMPVNASVVGLLLCAVWFLYFYGANLAPEPWFGRFSFDTSELPIVTLYAGYIPIFIMFIIKEKSLSFFKRFVIPVLAISGSIFMVIASCFSHGIDNVYYLIVFFVIIFIGWLFNKRKQEKNDIE